MGLVSLVINTRNRVKAVESCLDSVLKNSFPKIEIIIIDQSDNNNDNNKVKKLVKKISIKSTKHSIRYFKTARNNLAEGRNLGIQKAKGEIIVFTDDDCIVDKNWFKNIYLSFQKNKEVIGVFGRVLPYKPQLHKREICPCTVLRDIKKIINKPCFHKTSIGFGNNMSFRREIFDKVEGFKNWLGPGSAAKNGEEAEFVLRILLKGHRVLYNPQLKVYHHRWLTEEQFRRQLLFYSCGEVACYGYFAFQKKKFAKKIIKDNFKDSYWKIRKTVKKILLKRKGFRALWYVLEEFYFRLRGLLIGFYFSQKDPL